MYAVFGVTKLVARQRALKKIEKDGYDTEEHTSYDEALKAYEENAFATMRETQLSTLYSSRARAEEYVDLAKKDGARVLRIRRRVQKGFDAVKQEPILAWESA